MLGSFDWTFAPPDMLRLSKTSQSRHAVDSKLPALALFSAGRSRKQSKIQGCRKPPGSPLGAEARRGRCT